MRVNLLSSNSDSMHARSPCLELNIACMQFSDAVIIYTMSCICDTGHAAEKVYVSL